MKYNTDPNFWNEPRSQCNCGSLAFNLDEWYHPGALTYIDSETELYDYLESCNENYIDDDELANELAELYLSRIIADFGDQITEPTTRKISEEEVDEGEEIIAFRAGAYEWGDDFDYDFHFKVYRDGEWIEKLGGGAIELTTPYNWDGSMYYNSETFYFIHRLIGEMNY